MQPQRRSNRQRCRAGDRPGAARNTRCRSATSDSSSTFTRGFGNWVHRIEGGGKLDVKFGVGGGRSDSDTAALPLRRARRADRPLRRRRPVAQHRLQHRRQVHHADGRRATCWRPAGTSKPAPRPDPRLAATTALPQFDDSGADLSADTRRLAAFVQDEWDITQAMVGLLRPALGRHPHHQRHARGAEVENNTSVCSPVLHDGLAHSRLREGPGPRQLHPQLQGART